MGGEGSEMNIVPMRYYEHELRKKRDLTFATQNLCWKHVKYCTKMAYIKHRDELMIAVKHL